MNVLYIRDASGKFIPVPTISGRNGKSAYQYAQDGGYTGTEAEFAAKLAKEIPEAYTLPAATADRLGGMMPGDGLNVDEDGRVSVEPEGEYELIETIFVGYSLLAVQPDDWETNFGAYYEIKSGALSVLTAKKEFAPYTFYVSDDTGDVGTIRRTAEPDSTPYHLLKARIKFIVEAGAKTANLTIQINNTGLVGHTVIGAINTSPRYGYVWAYVENGYVFVNASTATTGQYSLLSANLPSYSRGWERGSEIYRIQIGASDDATFPVGSKFEIYGVRAK